MQKIIYARYLGDTFLNYRKGAVYKLWIKFLDTRNIWQKIFGKKPMYTVCIWKANRKNHNIEPDGSYYVYPSESEFWKVWRRDRLHP